jgi:site-specific recombinase XerD
MRIEDAVKLFLDHVLLERGCSGATADAYASDVRTLQQYLGGRGSSP